MLRSNRLLDRCRPLVLIPTLLLLATAARAPAAELPAPLPRLAPIAVPIEPLFDCNQNGIEDSVDIAVGSSSDANWNAIPDECEEPSTPEGGARDGPPAAPGTLGYHEQ